MTRARAMIIMICLGLACVLLYQLQSWLFRFEDWYAHSFPSAVALEKEIEDRLSLRDPEGLPAPFSGTSYNTEINGCTLVIRELRDEEKICSTTVRSEHLIDIITSIQLSDQLFISVAEDDARGFSIISFSPSILSKDGHRLEPFIDWGRTCSGNLLEPRNFSLTVSFSFPEDTLTGVAKRIDRYIDLNCTAEDRRNG